MNTQQLQPKSTENLHVASWTRIWNVDNDFRSIFDHPISYLKVPESERNSQGLDILATLFTNRLEEVKLNDVTDGNDTCPVCWEDYGKQEYECSRPLKTPCGHIYGRKCLIRTITEYQWKCAICRQCMLSLAMTAAKQQREREERYPKRLCKKLMLVGLFPIRITWKTIKTSLHQLMVDLIDEDDD